MAGALAAQALDEDWPDVLAALRAGLKDKDARKAAVVAVSYVQLVYAGSCSSPWTSSRLTRWTSAP